MNNDSKGMLYGLIGILSFGLTLPVTRYVIEYFSPMFIGLGRATVAGIFAAVLLIITRQSVPSKEQLYKLIIVALGVVVGFPVLSSVAMQTVPASHGGVVLAILPLATAIVGVVISNEKPSFGFWVTSVLGSMLVVIYSVLNGANALHWGDIALFFAVLSAAIGYSVGGLLSKEIGGWRVICWALVISTPFISIFALYHFPPEWSSVPINIWLGFLYLALVSQLIGFFFWNRGLAIGGVVRVSQIQLLQPFVTIIASALLLDEILKLETVIFALLIVILVAIGKKQPISVVN
ncbi:hypothetical protein A3762_01800 [Oleiphilus sp. HI0125]|uniref:DMT family transporter n=2 Tax=Oleiphilus sp. HI0125 TaxID=1822266 RepID=UPI0007C31B1C|nr:DMT family transporter [Oleiphilus sp. HI0125]KZZ62836.1 hypothetical protein A3762_01800 [Oleiphilus sp. HI0125]